MLSSGIKTSYDFQKIVISYQYQ